MVNAISRGQIRKGHPLWTDGWSITVGNSMSQPKTEPGKEPAQKPQPSEKSTETLTPITLSPLGNRNA